MAGHMYVNANLSQIKHIGVCKGSNVVQKIKKAYVWKNGAYHQVWSGASLVKYFADSLLIDSREVDEGLSVLSPSGVNPTKANYVFLGWNTQKDKAPLTQLLATGEPIDLYACWKRTVYPTWSYSGRKGERDRTVSGSSGSVVIDTTNASTLTLNITIRDSGSYDSAPSIYNYFTLNGSTQSVHHSGTTFEESDVTTYHTVAFDISNLSGNYTLSGSYSIGGRFHEDIQMGGSVSMYSSVTFTVS